MKIIYGCNRQRTLDGIAEILKTQPDLLCTSIHRMRVRKGHEVTIVDGHHTLVQLHPQEYFDLICEAKEMGVDVLFWCKPEDSPIAKAVRALLEWGQS